MRQERSRLDKSVYHTWWRQEVRGARVREECYRVDESMHRTRWRQEVRGAGLSAIELGVGEASEQELHGSEPARDAGGGGDGGDSGDDPCEGEPSKAARLGDDPGAGDLGE